MLHETAPAAGGVPEEIQHLDFATCVYDQHTQPTDADFTLSCRRCPYKATVCESHHNQIRVSSFTSFFLCPMCNESGPLTTVYDISRIGGDRA
jgi:hypothetical protein